MPITTNDVIAYLSAATASTGAERSTTAIASGTMNNLWPDITDAERIAGGQRFRKTFFKNNSETDELVLPVIYTPALPVNMTLSLGLGFDDTEDNDELQGNMLPLSTQSVIAFISDEPDSRAITVWGLDSAGTPTTEPLALTGTTEVSGVTVFSRVYAVAAEGASATADVEVRQGAGGAIIGSIPAGKLCCWLWIDNPSSKAEGIALPDLAPTEAYGVWRRLVWLAEAEPVRPNSLAVAIEEA